MNTDRRQELEMEYHKYIDQLAGLHLQNKEHEIASTLKIIASIQNQIRNLDIAEAISRLKDQQNNMQK